MRLTILFAMWAALAACGAAPKTFACGPNRCTADQACRFSCYGMAYSCEPLPTACTIVPTCGCLQDIGIGCDISSCSDSTDGLTYTCRGSC